MFEGARPVDEYYNEQKNKGVKFAEASEQLTLIRHEMAAYGDWNLYEDADGNLWEEYFSIGD